MVKIICTLVYLLRNESGCYDILILMLLIYQKQ